MSDTNNLYIFEALALRDEFDAHISLLKSICGTSDEPKSRIFSRSDDTECRIPSDTFDEKAINESLKKLQTKRLKLNNEIQSVNFSTKLTLEGETISIAEALEIKKSLKQEISDLANRTSSSAFSTVIHKEERDIIEKPRNLFSESYESYKTALKRFRHIEELIHKANHATTVSFKNE